MNFRQMEIFYAIITTGSVTAAARSLNLSQPAATKILRHAEDRLGFKLFHRIKGRLLPTDDAMVILHDVERVFQDVVTVRQTVSDVRLGRTGALSVVGVPPVCQVVIPKAIARFKQDRPEVQISFAQREGNAAMQYVATQRADIGLSFLVPIHSSLQSQTILERDMACIVPLGHPFASRSHVTALDMENQPLITYPNDSKLNPFIEAAFTSSRVEIRHSIQATSILTTWGLVQQGAGVGIVENISQLEDLYSNIAVVPFKPSIPIRLDVITPNMKPPSRLASQFIDTVRDVLMKSVP
ncbi:LysR substrate-binding domain-containing protein [Pseudoruegeria sp. HB172150]|uniref:LysR substrate-binding domain-containing protein n=1 Tax=Pseudoruegeria sp. HB172150 TaxID=2721164 RepID=UPI001555DDBB|nr:LysR substrate-binding domain-containing protein [Pseudoruegeria sp. HB172150]